jgi:hypothetical protein
MGAQLGCAPIFRRPAALSSAARMIFFHAYF